LAREPAFALRKFATNDEHFFFCANTASIVNMLTSEEALEGAAKDGSMDVYARPNEDLKLLR
jgi:hypothetical protein